MSASVSSLRSAAAVGCSEAVDVETPRDRSAHRQVNALFLAYFLLGEQKKVRRGAGRSARGCEVFTAGRECLNVKPDPEDVTRG